MNNKFRIVAILLLLLALAKIKIYAGEEISGQISDSSTGKPVQGAYLVASWNLQGGFHGESRGVLKILEAQTNKNGQFLISAWGPEFTTLGYLSAGDPSIFIFADGYKIAVLSNKSLNPEYHYLSTSDWNRKEIKLEKYTGEKEEYSNYISAKISAHFDDVMLNSPCEWNSIPAFKSQIVNINNGLKRLKINSLETLMQNLNKNYKCD